MSKNLGKSLTETLKEQATNFSKWQSASQAILNGCKSLKKMSNSVEEVNDSLVELGKQNNKREPIALYSWRLYLQQQILNGTIWNIQIVILIITILSGLFKSDIPVKREEDMEGGVKCSYVNQLVLPVHIEKSIFR